MVSLSTGSPLPSLKGSLGMTANTGWRRLGTSAKRRFVGRTKAMRGLWEGETRSLPSAHFDRKTGDEQGSFNLFIFFSMEICLASALLWGYITLPAMSAIP